MSCLFLGSGFKPQAFREVRGSSSPRKDLDPVEDERRSKPLGIGKGEPGNLSSWNPGRKSSSDGRTSDRK
jgi:hypothetical protein